MSAKSAQATCALMLLAYGIVLAVASPAGFPTDRSTGARMPYLADKPLGEDGFYMLTVGWNAGLGRGFSYNGGIRTTGIQPLSTLLDAAAARVVAGAGGDKWTFARVMVPIGIVELILFAALTRRLTATLFSDAPDAAAVAFLLTVTNYTLFRTFTYGLETGLYLILFACCVLATARGRIGPAAFGAAAGVTILARVDFAVILAVVLALSIVSRRMTIRGALTAGIVATAVCAPWFLYVHGTSGRWIPSSGHAEAWIVSGGSVGLRLTAMIDAVAQHVSPWLYLELLRAGGQRVAGASAASIVSWTIAAAAVALAGALVATLSPQLRARAWSALWIWTAAIALLAAVYLVVFDSTHFYLRYTAPLVIVSIPVLARAILPATTRVGGLPVLAAALVALFAVTAVATLHTGRLGNPHSLTAGFVGRALPRGARVGAFQSGVIGYFNENVVNLDGKVNDAVQVDPGGIEGYVDGAAIQYLVDWPGIIAAKVDRRWLETKWQPCAAQVPGGISICLVRRGR